MLLPMQGPIFPAIRQEGSVILGALVTNVSFPPHLATAAQEEKEWHTLLESVRSSSGVASSLVLSECPPEEDAALPGPTPEPDAVGALRTLRSDVHAHMVLQVEGLSMLTADVATLVEGAGAEARAAQREFHQERFRAFSHVDSPARLIQALTQAPLPLPGVEG